MKTPFDPRHQKRREIVRELFAWGFSKSNIPKEEIVRNIVSRQEEIDNKIGECAPEWPIGQINRVDLAILRLAVYELVIDSKEPPKVIIDEAVELAKEFGSESSPSFINGVLGTALKKWTTN